MKTTILDHPKLYILQDRFLTWSGTLNIPCYLTGGTAIGRFYLDHRFCDSLYFNIDDGTRYLYYISELKSKMEKAFTLDLQQCFFNEEFTRFVIIEDETILKIEMIRNTSNHLGKLTEYKYGSIDSPIYILPKKLRAILWRNETEDFFDIVNIAQNYAFNWSDIYLHAKQNSDIKISDIAKQLSAYPIDRIVSENWLKYPKI
jgi:hypothetical protein